MRSTDGRAVAACVIELLVLGHVASVDRGRLAQLGRSLSGPRCSLLALAVVSGQECVDRRVDLVGHAANGQNGRRDSADSQLFQARVALAHDFALAEVDSTPARRRASRQSSSPTSNIWQASGR